MDIKKLKSLIAKRQLTISELAKMAGLSPDLICKVLAGKRKPNLSTIGKLATALEVDPIELLKDEVWVMAIKISKRETKEEKLENVFFQLPTNTLLKLKFLSEIQGTEINEYLDTIIKLDFISFAQADEEPSSKKELLYHDIEIGKD